MGSMEGKCYRNQERELDTDTSQPEILGSRWQADRPPQERSHYLSWCVFSNPHPLSQSRRQQESSYFISLMYSLSVVRIPCSVTSAYYIPPQLHANVRHPIDWNCERQLFFCPKLMQNSKEWCFQVNLNYSGLPLFSSHVKNKVWQGWQEESSSLCPEVKLLSGEGRNKLLQKSGGFTDNSCYYLCQTGKASSECGKEERGMLFIQCWKTDYLPDCKEYQKGIESLCLN